MLVCETAWDVLTYPYRRTSKLMPGNHVECVSNLRMAAVALIQIWRGINSIDCLPLSRAPVFVSSNMLAWNRTHDSSV